MASKILWNTVVDHIPFPCWFRTCIVAVRGCLVHLLSRAWHSVPSWSTIPVLLVVRDQRTLPKQKWCVSLALIHAGREISLVNCETTKWNFCVRAIHHVISPRRYREKYRTLSRGEKHTQKDCKGGRNEDYTLDMITYIPT